MADPYIADLRIVDTRERKTGPRNIPELDEDEFRLDELDVTQVNCLGKDRYSKLLLSGDGKKVNKVDGPPACVYCLIMRCTSRNITTKGKVKLAKQPLDVLCIQEAIECDYNIPISVQQLRYKSSPISSREYVRTLGIKHGDTLELTYLCEAEIDDIRVVVNWFRFLKLFLKDHHPSIWSELSTECNLVMGMGINEDLLANLALEKFRPWGSPMKEANKHFFLQLKGLAMLVCVYEVMLMESWKTMLLRLKMVEGGMLLAIANFASTDEFQEEVLSLDTVGLCTQSFVRVLLRRGQAVVDTSGSPGRQEHNDLILKEVIESALEVLYSFRENKKTVNDIGGDAEVVEQLLSVAHCPSFTVRQAQMALCILVCCLYSVELHSALGDSSQVDGVMDACKTWKGLGAEESNVKLLRYYSQIYVSHLLVTSPRTISKRLYEKLQSHLSELFRTCTPKEIAQCEERAQVKWNKFLPLLRLFFTPNSPKRRSTTPQMLDPHTFQLIRLQESAVETAAFALTCMLSHKTYTIEAGLQDYIRCIPWYVPPSCLVAAREAVAKLRGPRSPPSLSTIARAKLAKTHFGLEGVVNKTADDIYKEVYPPPPPPEASPGPPSKSLYYVLALQ